MPAIIAYQNEAFVCSEPRHRRTNSSTAVTVDGECCQTAAVTCSDGAGTCCSGAAPSSSPKSDTRDYSGKCARDRSWSNDTGRSRGDTTDFSGVTEKEYSETRGKKCSGEVTGDCCKATYNGCSETTARDCLKLNDIGNSYSSAKDCSIVDDKGGRDCSGARSRGCPGSAAMGCSGSGLTVLGTGEFGRALTSCFTRAGYKVKVASRNPELARARVQSCGGEVVTIEDGLTSADIVVVALPSSLHATLPRHLLANKIVVDVSNRTPNSPDPEVGSPGEGPCSLGERFQKLFPEAKVVKAFNTLSAYTLERGVQQGTKQVPICGNDDGAKLSVASLVRSIGCYPEDRGCISQAGTLEDIPLRFFPEWKLPLITAATILAFFWTLLLFRTSLCPNFASSDGWDWKPFVQVLLNNAQLSFALTALTLLALCYCPGLLAAYTQLFRGTKHLRFPRWLDLWLRARKHLGLVALQLAGTHAIAAAAELTTWGLDGDSWTQQLFLVNGVMALGLMTILGLSSLPSVSGALSWREFTFLQTRCGWLAMVCATLHPLFYRWQNLITPQFQCVVIPDPGQIVLPFPLLVVLFKLPLLLPFVDSRLQKIRHGGA